MSHPDPFAEMGGHAVIETLAGMAVVVALAVLYWFRPTPEE